MISVRAAVRVVELESDALASQARPRAGRKVMRFLDGVAMPPFLAAIDAYAQAPLCDPADVALFSVTGWDAGAERIPIEPGVEVEWLISRFLSRSPIRALHTMSNNALCQAAIVSGFKGPNMHCVGDGDTLCLTLSIAEQTLIDTAAKLAIVVAFDVSPDERRAVAPSRPSSSVAVALAPVEDDSLVMLEVVSPQNAAQLGALEALAACVDAIERARASRCTVTADSEDGTFVRVSPQSALG